jgi:hypothetical protein
MRIESEVSGSCVEEIDASVGMENRGVGFDAGGIIWDLLWQNKRLKIGGGGRRWCQVLLTVLGALGVIEELKNTLWWQGLGG